MKKNNKTGLVVLFVALFLFWWILASKSTWIDLIAGALAALLIVLYSIDLVFSKEESSGVHPRKLSRYLVLFFVFIIEMVKANFAVVKIVLSPKIKVTPGFKKIKQPLTRELNQALFGNAITLTPGTLTVDMDKEWIIVHGLNAHNVDDIKDSPIERAFKAIEGDNGV